MIIVENPALKVFERWSDEAAKVVCGNNFSMDTSKIPKRFPYMRMKYLGGVTTKSDLDGNESAQNISFQIESFSRSLSEAYHLDEVSHISMIGMGFRRTYHDTVENKDGSIKRVVSRYSRIYTGNLL